MADRDTIQVVARFRPINPREKGLGEKEDIEINDVFKGQQVTITNKNNVRKTFGFTKVFGTNASQREVYEGSVKSMADRVMEGYNCTVFAYGQTGSGKTYSMEGQLGTQNKGIVPRLIEDVFEKMMYTEDKVFMISVSYVEIYLEKIRDLLSPAHRNLNIVNTSEGIDVPDAEEYSCRTSEEVLRLMTVGAQNRKIAKTGMNNKSSRSHGVFILRVKCRDQRSGTITSSKLLLVDLAGSEKVRNTGATGLTLDQAKAINMSLSFLGNTLNTLAEARGKPSYRSSKLTYLLSDSLGGNSKTALIVCCSPCNVNFDETKSTLQFGSAASKVTNKPKRNEQRTVPELEKLLGKANVRITKLTRVNTQLKRDLRLAIKGKIRSEADAPGLQGQFLGGDESSEDGASERSGPSVGEDEMVLKRKEFDDVRQKLAKMTTNMILKDEQIGGWKSKLEDAQLECERLLAEQKTSAVQVEELTRELSNQKSLQASLESEREHARVLLEETHRQAVERIRRDERQRMQDFIRQTKEALEQQQPHVQQRFGFIPQAQAAAPAAKFDKVRLENQLQLKEQESREQEDRLEAALRRIAALEAQVRRKDVKLRDQHNELVLFASLKSTAAEEHHKATAALGRQVARLKRRTKALQSELAHARNVNSSIGDLSDLVGSSEGGSSQTSKTAMARFPVWIKPPTPKRIPLQAVNPQSAFQQEFMWPQPAHMHAYVTPQQDWPYPVEDNIVIPQAPWESHSAPQYY